jgi:hypothetical protein
VRFLFQFLRISNPSLDEIMFITSAGHFGFYQALWLSGKFEWRCKRVINALTALMYGSGLN